MWLRVGLGSRRFAHSSRGTRTSCTRIRATTCAWPPTTRIWYTPCSTWPRSPPPALGGADGEADAAGYRLNLPTRSSALAGHATTIPTATIALRAPALAGGLPTRARRPGPHGRQLAARTPLRPPAPGLHVSDAPHLRSGLRAATTTTPPTEAMPPRSSRIMSASRSQMMTMSHLSLLRALTARHLRASRIKVMTLFHLSLLRALTALL